MIPISRTLALNKLESLYSKEGFSLLTVRTLIHQIYDSFESSGVIEKPKYPKSELQQNTFGNQRTADKVSESISLIQGKEVIPFTEDLMKAVLASPDVTSYSKFTGRYELSIKSFGKVNFYPKANKIQIHKTNDWIEPGTNWLMKNT